MTLRFPARPTSGPRNPVVEGRAAFEGAFADLARGKRNWQLVTYALLFLVILLTLAYVGLSTQSRITPYIVEVDKLSRPTAFGPAEQLRLTDYRIVAAELSLFIANLRTVYADPVAQRDTLYRAYAYAGSDARAFLDAYFLEPDNDPRLLSQSIIRSVEVDSVLQIPKTRTWKVQWAEYERPRFAGSPRQTAWEAYLTIAVDPPKTTDSIQRNPLGLWVQAITWTRISSAKGA